jgi:hypothetical protein
MKLVSVLLVMCMAMACQGAHHRSSESVALPRTESVIVEVKLSYDAAHYITQDQSYAVVTNELTHRGVRIAQDRTMGSRHFRVNIEVLRIAQAEILLILEADYSTYPKAPSQGKSVHPTRCVDWEHERSLPMPERELTTNLGIGLCGVVAQFTSEYLDGHKSVFEDCKE